MIPEGATHRSASSFWYYKIEGEISERYEPRRGWYQFGRSSVLLKGKKLVPVSELTLESLKKRWKELGNIPVDENDCIDQNFWCFPCGTYKFEVWQWFDRNFPDGLIKFLEKHNAS